MDELISLDYSNSSSHSLCGVDIDTNTIEYVQTLLGAHSQKDHVTLINDDAWDFKMAMPADLIVSNGLNIYVKDDQKVTELYQHFYDQLKPGGELITSFLTHPPVISPQTEWNLSEVNQEDALRQKIIMADVLGVSWQFYRSIEQTTEQLQLVGFEAIQIISDRANIFPTVIAKKPRS
ncbi:MAG: hypothetical protein S4CHLAM6_05610 [Chlamydiae bacterium]|nr:hypothetical protein [Chlamydiota bacterium]